MSLFNNIKSFFSSSKKKVTHKLGPYRAQAEMDDITVKEEEEPAKTQILFEEKILRIRMHIPGPIRRMAGVVLFLPTISISFVLAVLLAPLCWIATGFFTPLWDRSQASTNYTGWRNYWTCNPLLRGTSAIFFDKEEFYEKLRKNSLSRL